MAVTYQIHGEDLLKFGGEINPTNGLAGPFPRYSISKEAVFKDSLFIANKYNITITGTALINTEASMLVEGARQNKIHENIKEIVFAYNKIGTLEIAPYGGGANILSFNDAILLNAEAAEQDDTSQGTQNQNYTFTFEAYRLAVGGSNIDETIETKVDNVIYDLADVSESWDYNLDEEYSQTSFQQDTETSVVYRNFTISHTISATGRVKKTGAQVDSGYIQAKNYVEAWLTKIGNNPFATSIVDHSRGTAKQVEFENLDKTSLNAFNQVNQYTKDILEGTYSVTRTWKVSKEKAITTISFDLNQDPSAEFNTVSLSVNITGLETIESDETVGKNTSNKYQNALAVYNVIYPGLSSLATAFHTARIAEGTLRTTPSSLSSTHDQTSGIISISATFDDAIVPENVLSMTVNITCNNEDGLSKIVAILPVIAKSDGPIIQNMNTTKERTRSISMDWVMNKANRTTKPSNDALSYIENNFKPSGVDNLYLTNKTETWNPRSGQYNISVDYTWTKNTPTN